MTARERNRQIVELMQTIADLQSRKRKLMNDHKNAKRKESGK